jgi:hypothetical protein
MTRRIAFTPTKAQAHLIEGYRKTYKLDKPQDVLSAALSQLERAEKVRAYNRLAGQMQADSSLAQDEAEAAEVRKELVPGEEREPKTEAWSPPSPLPSSHGGGTE